MNLETLRQKIQGQTTTVVVGDESYHIAKMSALDGLEVAKLLRTLGTVGEGEAKDIENPADLVTLYAMLISKSVVDEQGEKLLDSDEARAMLPKWGGCLQLGEAVMDWTIPAQKKS